MIDESPKLFGIVGYPLTHSLSPLLHNRIYKVMGQNAIYQKFETQDLKACLDKVKALGVKGLSVTIPHKEKVIPMLDELDPNASYLRAVNTILNHKGKLVGFNTDAPGAIMAIRDVMDPKGANCLVVGAGGTGRALALSLKREGAELYITNRSEEKGVRLAQLVNGCFLRLEEIKGRQFDLVVQATSLGMYPTLDAWPFDIECIKAGVVMEVVYNPLETKFLRKAKEMGSLVIPGYKMFLYQAMLQIRLFIEKDPPLNLMEQIVLEAL